MPVWGLLDELDFDGQSSLSDGEDGFGGLAAMATPPSSPDTDTAETTTSGRRHSLRAVVQGLMLARHLNLDAGTKRSYMKDMAVDQETIGTIDKDLPRTASGDLQVVARLGWIRSMLLRQLAEDPQLGYCQGMNLVAAVFAIATETQGDAYRRFHAFTDRMRGLWLPGFPLLEEGTARFVSLARRRPWFQHLQAYEVEPSMFLPQALMTMLAMWLPMSTIAQCLRLPERHGLDGMLAMVLAVLDHAQEQLLQQHSMDDLLHVLRDVKHSAPPPRMLKVAAHKMLRDKLPVRQPTRTGVLKQQGMNGLLLGLLGLPDSLCTPDLCGQVASRKQRLRTEDEIDFSPKRIREAYPAMFIVAG